MKSYKGRIVKSTAGFYYVKTDKGVTIECRARGIFRKLGIKPLVGDNVTVSSSDGIHGSLDEIDKRKNFLLRPQVANVDVLLIFSSVKEPSPNLVVIDKMTCIAHFNGIECCVIFTKCDLADAQKYTDIYSKSGFTSFGVSAVSGMNADRLKEIIDGRLCVLTGNSGVGKSSVLNMLEPELELPTGEISDKLGRGRHTTRTVELFEVCGGIAVDTPGFSSLEMERTLIDTKRLAECFPEFSSHLGRCKFATCSHTGEQGCKICEALNKGEIEKTRYDSYKMIYDEIKDIRKWQSRQ